jgi:phospholipid-binding lipoprotein MlaA
MRRILIAVLMVVVFPFQTMAAEPFSLASFRQELASAPLPKPKPQPPLRLAEEDMLEGFNRRIFAFNSFVAREVIEPTGEALDANLPGAVKQAGRNFYSNIIELEFLVTNMMVSDFNAAGISAARFTVNTTVGVLGAWDPASEMGLARKEVEFTEGLCAVGMRPGEFVVLPLVGPTSANTALLLGGFFAIEWWALSLLSPTLATIDLVTDLIVAAASLRYVGDVPDGESHDPYAIQRAEYRSYIAKGCKG